MFKGFSLFNDIADPDLRTRNRACILCNIAQDNTKNKSITAKGAGIVLGYFGLIPEDERDEVKQAFKVGMIQRGYALS